jgi:AcrR family transcriptional regulator
MQTPVPAADVKTRILQAALGVLAEHGAAELTQPKVARAAGVRQSHLTYYFPTRGDLLLAVAQHSVGSLMGALTQAAQSGRLTLAGLGQFMAEAILDKRRARVMLGLIVSSDEDRRLKDELRRLVQGVRSTLVAVLGQLGVDADMQSVAAWHSLLVGAAMLHVARDDAASAREAQVLARFVAERLTAGQRCPRDRASRKVQTGDRR